MGKKIIRLTESELYSIVKRVIKEEVIDKSYYRIEGTGLIFQIIDGKLYTAKLYRNGEVEPEYALNGDLYDFKVNYKTGEIVDEDYNQNVEYTDWAWQNITAANVQPMQYNGVDYRFIAVVPSDASSKNAAIGKPIVYTAKISQLEVSALKAAGFTQSNDDTISPNTYHKKGGIGIYIQLFPGANRTSYYPGGSTDKVTTTTTTTVPKNGKPFELNITSPFKFDSTELTDTAQAEFNKFIQSVKDNYKDISGNVQVICSSSIDGDPEGKVKTGQKRYDYDMDLSNRRAQTIVATLNSSLPGFKLKFVPKGIGQTDQYAVGKKWPEVKNQDETAPNRRLIIKLPSLMKT